jgi:ABC-type sugar transport system substrate-binding protein
MNKITDDFGIFNCDSTQEICQVIKDGGGIRGIISLGTGRQHGIDMVTLALAKSRGQQIDFYNYLPIIPVTRANVVQFAAESGYTLR